MVVGAAIVADGRVLAARRTAPADLSGRWEFPGGKVEADESVEQACRREIGEELGLDISVGEPLRGEQGLPSAYVLQVHACALLGGEPQLREHDAVRWLAPEELGEMDWLAAERPFLPELFERLLDGQRLHGGNVGGAVRVGGTVRRETGPWTPAVHGLLGYVAARGLSGVPRVLGTDVRGREVLTYLAGEVVGHDDDPVPDALVVSMMRWFAAYHRVVREYRPDPAARWRNDSRGLGPGEVVCHHDFAPYNVVGVDSALVGVIDWDMAGPGRPVEDLAFAAWNCVPMHTDVGVVESVRRLRLMCDAYGGADPVEVLGHVVPRLERALSKIAAGQAAGDPGMLNLAKVGEPARSLASLDALRTRVPVIELALRSDRHQP